MFVKFSWTYKVGVGLEETFLKPWWLQHEEAVG